MRGYAREIATKQGAVMIVRLLVPSDLEALPAALQ